jgi:Xaa-Pro dipeptidase
MESWMVATEEQRASELLEAQAKAEALFHAVEARGLIRAGISENNLNAEIYALAQEMYGIRTYRSRWQEYPSTVRREPA